MKAAGEQGMVRRTSASAGPPLMPFVLPDRPALFLDFDGTLVEIARNPEGVEVADRLTPILRRVVDRLDGAVAVVTGRRIADIDTFLGLPIAAAGLHGLETRPAPGELLQVVPPPPEIDVLRQRLSSHPVLGNGVMLEDKGAGLVLHYRNAPERADEVKAAMDAALDGLTEALHVVPGKMVLEAKRRGFDKGEAVRAFMAHPPFAGRTPIFFGDDVTDEDGMRAAAALGGFGVKIGEGDTVAAHRLGGVADMHAFLSDFADGS